MKPTFNFAPGNHHECEANLLIFKMNEKIQMIRDVLLIALLIVSTFGFGQSNYSAIDKNSTSVPDSLTGYNEIANHLTVDLKTDTEKARAIYIWIAHNVKYDLTQLYSDKRYNSSQDIVNEVLNDRQGVCQHYSELFLAMSKSVGLKSFLISGYTRDVYDEIAAFSHAWNGIRIDSDYYLIDVTWAAGYELNGKYVHKFRDDYFLRSPKDFIKDHMPFDPMWQFLDNPITNNDFIAKDFSKLNRPGDFNYKDLIIQYETLNELTQLENATRRIRENGVVNKLIQNQVDENILRITNRKYNMAIDTLNYGINSYNLYVFHKNRKFRNPKIDDTHIKDLIYSADKSVFAANQIFYGLFSSDYELNRLIVEARNRMPGLISDLEREKDFVDRYLKKWKPLRIFMFPAYAY